MENLFFNSVYSNLQQLFLELAAFVFMTGIFLWIIDLGLTKILFKRVKQRKEISLRLCFLWSIFTYFILFNIYLFGFFYRTGIEVDNFLKGRFYLGIMAQLFIYFGLIILFFVKRYSLKKIIKDKSIN
jgi:hypothetical protein